MQISDSLSYASRALFGHRLRSLLSLIGMAVGVAAVVMLTALGEGARAYVTDQFTNLGTNLVIVVPGKNETTGTVPGIAGVPNDLTLGDAEAILRKIPQAQRVAPLSSATEAVSNGERSRQVAIFGATREYFQIRQVQARHGDLLPAGDFSRGRPVVVLGPKTAQELFGESNPTGKTIRVGSWRMRVVGVTEPKGVQLGVDLDDLAIIPVATALKMFNRRSLFRILVEVRSHLELESAKESILKLIEERHGEEDITCLTQDSVVSTLSSIVAALTAALAAIATISLSVAGIGIMNVMLVSVSERGSEIGLLKALGAKPRQIQKIFLIESALLSTAGAGVGLVLGSLAVFMLDKAFPAFSATTPIWAVVAAFGVAMIFGVVFGVLPALRAMRLDPIIALGRG